MVLLIPEEGSISITGYVTSPGYQSIVPRGYLLSEDEEYIAPLLPQLFYGASGDQLGHTWRQNLTETGSQVILSRIGGEPSVPKEELFWVRREQKEEKVKRVEKVKEVELDMRSIALASGAILIGLALVVASR